MKQLMITAAAALLCLQAMAQDDATYSMYVYLSDGSVVTYNVAEVDSVVFAEVADETNGYEYVDLGLSVKWAACNVGSDSASDYGSYYAWGETTTKSSYSTANGTTYGVEMDDIAGNADYDAAAANWGGAWRMPTYNEYAELIDSCTWEWTTQDDIYGYLVTGPSGNSIFLPAAGYRRGGWLYSTGGTGCYWCSTPAESGNGTAGTLYFISSSYSMENYYRYRGHTIRPVLD